MTLTQAINELNGMKLTEAINNYPYFKVNNCTDLGDVENALKEADRLEDIYGESKTLNKVFAKLIRKKEKFLGMSIEDYTEQFI